MHTMGNKDEKKKEESRENERRKKMSLSSRCCKKRKKAQRRKKISQTVNKYLPSGGQVQYMVFNHFFFVKWKKGRKKKSEGKK